MAEEFRNKSGLVSEWPDEYGLGTALANLGNVYKREGEYDKAIEYFQKSLAEYRKIDADGTKYGPQITDCVADIGRTYLARGDYVRALVQLDMAIGLAKKSRDPNRMAGILNSIGILYTNQRDYAKAIEFFQQGLQLASSVNDRFKQASMLLNISVAYQFRGDYECYQR